MKIRLQKTAADEYTAIDYPKFTVVKCRHGWIVYKYSLMVDITKNLTQARQVIETDLNSKAV